MKFWRSKERSPDPPLRLNESGFSRTIKSTRFKVFLSLSMTIASVAICLEDQKRKLLSPASPQELAAAEALFDEDMTPAEAFLETESPPQERPDTDPIPIEKHIQGEIPLTIKKLQALFTTDYDRKKRDMKFTASTSIAGIPLQLCISGTNITGLSEFEGEEDHESQMQEDFEEVIVQIAAKAEEIANQKQKEWGTLGQLAILFKVGEMKEEIQTALDTYFQSSQTIRRLCESGCTIKISTDKSFGIENQVALADLPNIKANTPEESYETPDPMDPSEAQELYSELAQWYSRTQNGETQSMAYTRFFWPIPRKSYSLRQANFTQNDRNPFDDAHILPFSPKSLDSPHNDKTP